MKRWYVAKTKSRSERCVSDVLVQRNLETFLPEVPRNWTTHQPVPFIPLFPGYLFVRFDYKSTSASVWRWVPGLNYILGYGDQPAIIPDDVICVIRENIKGLAVGQDLSPFCLQPGDLVSINNGPFIDLIVIFEQRLGVQDRVQVLLKAIDRSIRLELNETDLELVQRAGRPRFRGTRGRGRKIGHYTGPSS